MLNSENPSKRLLLISSSNVHGYGYLDHAESENIGSSAGSIVAGPTLKTTKDMPVVQPPSFDALGLVGFQISPHYLDPDPKSTHMGETQEERIMQYLEENDRPVVGLREGTLLHVHKGSIILRGSSSARVFRRGHSPVEVPPGTDLCSEAASAATRAR